MLAAGDYFAGDAGHAGGDGAEDFVGNGSGPAGMIVGGDALPFCSPRMITSSPVAALGMWVMSTTVKSIDTRPTIGAGIPWMSTWPPGAALVLDNLRFNPSA